MFKSEAESLVRRCMQETKAEFTDKQITCLAEAMLKITERAVEEALAAASSNSLRKGYPALFSYSNNH